MIRNCKDIIFGKEPKFMRTALLLQSLHIGYTFYKYHYKHKLIKKSYHKSWTITSDLCSVKLHLKILQKP